jgi:hypothetical protein
MVATGGRVQFRCVLPLCTFVSFVVYEVQMLEPQRHTKVHKGCDGAFIIRARLAIQTAVAFPYIPAVPTVSPEHSRIPSKMATKRSTTSAHD